MPFTISHTGDLHLEEDHYFADTAHCIEWFVEDSIQQGTGLFVLDGDLTTYKQTIKERKFWVDAIVRMANHAPVLLIAGNHGKELEDDLYPLAKIKGKNPVFLATEPDFIDLDGAAIAVFPYPRKAEFVSEASEGSLAEAFTRQLQAFNEQFDRRPGAYRLFFGHFGVAGARVSGGQPLAGRCAEYPLEPLRNLQAQYVGLSHIHLRQQLLPRVWYAGSLSRCDYSESEEKGYHLVRLNEPLLQSDLSDLDVEFRISPTRSMVELRAVYEGGEFRFHSVLDANRLKGSRVKVVVTVPSELHSALSREEQERLKTQLLAASPAELKVKIEHEAEEATDAAPLSQAKSAEAKLRAYLALKGVPSPELQERLLAKLAFLEIAVMSERK
ncbi:MAG TPA: metallophosphoesterase [Terriglobia bacterium]|nr:metallophosphoesterase [Terriglobia bacterium]